MTKTPRLIAFNSPAMGSGKSTAAHYLVDTRDFVRLSFGTGLKAISETLLREIAMGEQEIHERVYGSRKEENIPLLGITCRRLQQLVGTEFGRKLIHPELWTITTMARVKAYLASGRSVVIDDLRHHDEYRALTEAGAICRRIIRPGAVVTSTHSSEGQLDGIAMPEIWNDGDLNKLYRAVDLLLAE